MDCKLADCPIHASWNQWSTFSACVVTCGVGQQFRRRTCGSNVFPIFNGRTCFGKSVDIKSCERDICPINGDWSLWSQWSICNMCGDRATKKRARKCDSPSPKFNGITCDGEPIEVEPCFIGPCTHAELNVRGELNHRFTPDMEHDHNYGFKKIKKIIETGIHQLDTGNKIKGITLNNIKDAPQKPKH